MFIFPHGEDTLETGEDLRKGRGWVEESFPPTHPSVK